MISCIWRGTFSTISECGEPLPQCVRVCVCVFVRESLRECGKARCSTTRSPNRAETQTTCRSNEGGNEKVIFTNFAELHFHSVWLCVPSASLRATSATTRHAYATEKEWGGGGGVERKGQRSGGERLQAGDWVSMWKKNKKAKAANPPRSYRLLLSRLLLIKVDVIWDNEALCRDVLFFSFPLTKSAAKQLPLISVSRAPLNSWLQPLIWSHHNHYLWSQGGGGGGGSSA